MKLFQPHTRKRRMFGAVFALSCAVTILLVAFFQVQVVGGEQYAVRSEENRLRPITIPAPRGTIVDRHGEVMATSVTGYSVQLLPSSVEVVRRTLNDLAPFLGLAQPRLEELMEERDARPNDLLEISRDASYAQVAAIEERRAAFPNLVVAERPKRYYPGGEAVGHLMGYLGEVSERELELPRFEQAGYRQGRIIGKGGIERQYELLLGGEDGARFVEVDAHGRVVDPDPGVRALPPEPGRRLRLTIDARLQEYVAEIFPDSMKGAIVAMIPSTGEVLAMYSNPGYDPNDFVGGIRPGVWNALNTDPDKPLLNRAINAIYPPGSTWKLATAAAGLEAGVITPESVMPIPCSGGMLYAGRYARCWRASGHGSLNLIGAIQNSCNVYFYQVGIRLGLARLIEAGVRIGFNSEAGIDLPEEMAGIFPQDIEWYQERFGHTPTPSEVMSLSIGQGPNSQTVLRMAHFYSAIAGNGSAPEPHLVANRQGAGAGPGAIEMEISQEDLAAIWSGAEKVVEQGTGILSDLANWEVYGKTGTSQNPHGGDHGWFTGFAGPIGEPPEIAFAVIVEHGLHGSDVSPIATKAANFYLSREHGVPLDLEPTRWEHILGGRPWQPASRAP
ncbi:MAG: penicillin-binding protein 2 [Longimicrobiaceae bacterium]